MTVIRELADIVALHDYDAEILAASVRHPRHVTEAALAGAHIATIPFKVLQQMVHHPLTDRGIELFKADWAKATKEAGRQGLAGREVAPGQARQAAEVGPANAGRVGLQYG